MTKVITVIFVAGMIFSTFGSIVKINNCQSKENIISYEETEYWALLVGCTEFDILPILNLGGNDRVVMEIKNLLLASDHWQQNHIKILTGKNATKKNIWKFQIGLGG